MAPSARRSTGKRKLNHVLIDEDEKEEHELQQNGQQLPMGFTKEIENALKICKFWLNPYKDLTCF